MANATVLHTVRGETSSVLTAAGLLLVVTFVAYMRWKVKPLAGSNVDGNQESVNAAPF